jgi:asparagine synthase (glutamine-hydrolysing)
MCGITGIVNLSGRPADARILEEMSAVIRHRGPDDEGILLEGPVGLHHRRLSIIDLTTGHQPMTSGPVSIVYNGEIYNYLELRQQLEGMGRVFVTRSDTEVILQSYLQWGPDCVRRFNGMFAFLLFDRANRQIMAARDHFGIKPLYVHQGPDGLVFGSEIKALLRHPDIRASVDCEALKDYITFQFVLGDQTLFQGIRKIPPAHYILIDLDTGSQRPVRYWEPAYQVDVSHTERWFIEQLRGLLEDSIRLQMRSDVPVGSYLSGGMDSSLITMLAARHATAGFKSFTGFFREGSEYDETVFAHEVAAACGADLHEIAPTAQEFMEFLPRLVYHMDEPVAGPGLFPQYMVTRRGAREVKVLLGGQGGDEVFGGYARYVVAYLEQVLKGAIFETNEEGEHIVSLKSILPNLPYLQAYVPMLSQFWRQGLFGPMDRRYFQLVDRLEGGLSLFTQEFRSSYDQEPVFHRFQSVFNRPNTPSYYNRMTSFDLETSLPALLHVEDRVSMACSVESRVPLLDYRIVDLLASAPAGLKFRGGEMKYIMKEAVKDIVPPNILQRKDKMGFPVPLHLWAAGPCRDFFRDTLLSSRAAQRGIFEPAEVEKLMDYQRPFSRRLWGMLCLELWHREFIDVKC